MDQKEYVKLLESAVAKNPGINVSSPGVPRNDATAKKIVNWDGQGKLPETLERDELDEMVDNILGKEDNDVSLLGEEETNEGESPIEKLEEENSEEDDAGEADNEAGLDMEIDESDVSFSDEESEILNKLVSEMDEMEFDMDEEIDDGIYEEDDDVDEVDAEDLGINDMED